MGKYDVITKPEARDMIALWSEKNRAKATIYTEKFMSFERAFLRYASGQTNRQTNSHTRKETDRQTYRHAHCNTSHPYWGRGNKGRFLCDVIPCVNCVNENF